MASWADLPRDILDQVVESLVQHLEVLRFSQVCKSWRCCVAEKLTHLPSKSTFSLSFFLPRPRANPLLFLPSTNNGTDYGGLYCPRRKELLGEYNFPEALGKWWCSTSFGWIMLVDLIFNLEELLFNPVTRARLPLPPIRFLPIMFTSRQGGSPADYIVKAVLSADPHKEPENWKLMVIGTNHRKLCFCGPKDDKWTLVEFSKAALDASPRQRYLHMHDVVYSDGKFYAINVGCHLYVCDFGSTNWPPMLELLAPGAPPDHFVTNYLVFSSRGRLLHIRRRHKRLILIGPDGNVESAGTKYFKVNEFVEEECQWRNVTTLGDDTLFLGRNTSLCFSHDVLPVGFRKNCIYFSDETIYYLYPPRTPNIEDFQCRDSGIYDYENGTIESFDLQGSPVWMPSLWINPSPPW